MKNLGVKNMALCAMFAALIAAGAMIRLTIPIYPLDMHFSLQWLSVLLASLLLEEKTGAYSVAIYLLIGLIGIPVFASGGGIGYILKPTFGFLLGFLAAAYVMCFLKEKTSMKRLMITLAGLLTYYLCGMVYFYVIGTFVLNMQIGWQIIFINCFLITIVPDLLLCIVAVMIAGRLEPLLHINQKRD